MPQDGLDGGYVYPLLGQHGSCQVTNAMESEVLHSGPFTQNLHEVLPPLVRGAVRATEHKLTNPLFVVLLQRFKKPLGEREPIILK